MRDRGDGKAALVFLAPYGVLFLVFVVTPLIYGFWISLHNWHVLSANTPFVGLANYATALQDDLFRISMARTFLFVVLAVPVGNAISLLFAIGLNQDFRGTTLYKVAFYLPVVMSITVVAILWRWIYSAEFGLLNHYLHSIGSALDRVPIQWGWYRSTVEFFNGSFPWISSPQWAMPSIALLSVWWGAGGNMLIYLAALKAVPKELLEAAELDGAINWRRFLAVTWPSIRPAALFAIVMSIIAASQVFGQTYILTRGGPANSTLTVMLYMYQQGFGVYQLGYAAAVAYLLFLVVLVFSLGQFRLMRSALHAG